jgi:hypothetical protein
MKVQNNMAQVKAKHLYHAKLLDGPNLKDFSEYE